jgi:hypothetical protein
LGGEVREPDHHGFGTELLTRVLPYELDAKTELKFGRSGLSFHLELPERHLAEPAAKD